MSYLFLSYLYLLFFKSRHNNFKYFLYLYVFLMTNRAEDTHISLYTSQKLKINNFIKKSNRFKTPSSFIQYLVDDFFRTSIKTLKKDFMLFMGYPMIMMCIMFYVSWSTQNTNLFLMNKGFFYSDLYLNSRIYWIIGFATLGVFMAGTFWFVSRLRSKD